MLRIGLGYRCREDGAQTSQHLLGVPSSLLGQTGKLMISMQWNENHGWRRRVGSEYRGGKDLGKLLNIILKTEWRRLEFGVPGRIRRV